MPEHFWTVYWAAVAFIFGAIVGSFLNVCIWRMPQGLSLSDPPSQCPSCGHRLAFFPDMVPMLSQAWFRSRCRYCQARFSWRYFWVELATALLFLAVQLRYTVFTPSLLGETERGYSAVLAMLYVSALVVIFFIDLEHYIIPDLTVLVAVVMAVGKDALLIWKGVRPLWQQLPGTEWTLPLPLSVLGCLVAFWAMWQFAAIATALLGKEAMGAGDSLLLGAMGAFLVPAPLLIFAFIIAVALGTVGGVAGMLLYREPQGTPATGGESEAPVPEPVAHTADSVPIGDTAPPTTLEDEGEETQGEAGPEAGVGEQPGELEVPPLPSSSRIGRLVCVAASWLAVLSIWGAGMLHAQGQPLGVWLAALVGGLVLAAGLGYWGAQVWIRGDREWLPQMDAFFEEGEPGPRFVPFGPYLVAGTLIAMLIGNECVSWYLRSQLGMDPARLPWD